MVFLDLSAAFDSIDHSTLLCCLQMVWSWGLCFKWFPSYVRECYQLKKNSYSLSNLCKLLLGVFNLLLGALESEVDTDAGGEAGISQSLYRHKKEHMTNIYLKDSDEEAIVDLL